MPWAKSARTLFVAVPALALAAPFATSAALWMAAQAILLSSRGSFRPTRERSGTTIRSDIRRGISFLLGRPVPRTLALMARIANRASSPVFAVVVGQWLGVRSVFAVMGIVAASLLILDRRITDRALSDALDE